MQVRQPIGKAAPLLKKLKRLSPQDFEHLTYDLVTLLGLRNVKWRTPGPDGGRDIEGDYEARDFSGDIRTEKWYVECKRYSKTIDWPTVYGKLAYADSHDVDFLLVCTTASLSPQCRDQVTARERKNLTPRIRAWEGVILEHLVASQPLLMSKYQLSKAAQERELGTLPLLRVMMKMTQQIYGESIVKDRESNSVEFAAAISELVTSYLMPPSTHGNVDRHAADPAVDLYPWVECSNVKGLEQWDSYALRAILAGVRFLSKAKRVSLSLAVNKQGKPTIAIGAEGISNSIAANEIVNTISIVANWESDMREAALVILRR